MYEIFKTVLTLSVYGIAATAAMLILKPFAMKRLSAKQLYFMWIFVLFSFIVPIYKFIPQNRIEEIPVISREAETQRQLPIITDKNPEAVTVDDTDKTQKSEEASMFHIDWKNTAAVIWICGVCIYIFTICSSYAVYTHRRRKNSSPVLNNEIFESVRKELKIKRRISLNTADDISSPMLVGVIFPKIYIPPVEISDDNMRMIFLHELTHYKRGDLIAKWLVTIVNAIHWFNPIVYLIGANIGESCEILCDESVTKKMTDEERKLYMNTVLEFAAEN